jgi:hypothetical protein
MSDANTVVEVRPPWGSVLARIRPAQGWAALGHFLVISAQLALILLLLHQLEIERDAGFLRILPLVFGGFVVHAALPLRYRLPFFLLLSFTAIGIVLGFQAGALLVILGLGLVGLCHLPLAFSTRVVLLLVAGGALAALRNGWAPGLIAALRHPLVPALVLPVLGSMFMFRLIIYLYDLRQEEREQSVRSPGPTRVGPPASVWMRLSYFFLLPNVCFLLFPVVDYRTFCRNYYNSRPNEIYQRAIWWISLGLVYLLLYRLIYQYLVPSPEEVQGLGGVVRLVVASYLIYFRVVGLFHLIIGLLCLFGFNLPPVHHFYLLASGFTDFWRRARIDWKDFMVKVFYYPALVPGQRRWGAIPAMVLATVAVFIVTWLLHSYQWFWLQGNFPLSQADAVFWVIFGGCVLANSLLEAKRGRKRTRGWALGPAVVHALKVLGMFVFLCLLWSYWSSPSFAAWLGLVSAAGDSGPAAYGVLVAVLVAVVGVGVLAQFVAARIAPARVPGRAPARAAAPLMGRPIVIGVATTLLLVVEIFARRGSLGAPAAEFATRMSTNQLNATDQEREDRSYYEVLLDTPRSTLALAAAGLGPAEAAASEPGVEAIAGGDPATAQPADSVKHVTRSAQYIADSIRHMEWRRVQAASGRGRSVGRRVREYEAYTNDLRLWENVPNFKGSMKGARFSTNQWGMRDQEYSLARPAYTYRIALVGGSMTVGAGVPVEQTMETLTEDRLNREGPGAPERQYEILNFSVGGYGIFQNVAVVDQKVFAFSPNAILVSVFSVEGRRTTNYLTKVIRNRIPIPYPYVERKLREAGVAPSMEESELRRRIGPIAEDLVRWSYVHIQEVGRQKGVPVIGVVLPEPIPKAGRDIDQAVQLATASGLPLLDLRDVYQGYGVDSLKLEGRDPHWSVAGHRVIAERLFRALRSEDARTFKLGFGSRVSSGQSTASEQTDPAEPGLDDEAPLGPGRRRAPFMRQTNNDLIHELVPSFSGKFKGVPLRTNQWGMRDKEYQLKPSPGTYRIALLGSSFTFGAGVPAEQTIESLLEDRLNREGPGTPDRHYEILNFSVMRYGVLQYLGITEKKLFPFEPNAVLVVIHTLELNRMVNNLLALIRQGIPIEYPYMQQQLQQAGIRPHMAETELRRKLAPIAPDLVGWSYRRIAEICHDHDVPIVGIVFREPRAISEKELAAATKLVAAAGIPLIDIQGAYDGGSLSSYRMPLDAHLNPLGHKVVADRLYELLRANDARALRLGFEDRQ